MAVTSSLPSAALALALAAAPSRARADLPPSCDQPRAIADPIPAWSRLTGSIALGAAVRAPDTLESTFVVAPQLGVALWAREWTCVDHGGGIFVPPQVWIRWSLSLTGDLLWRPGPGVVNDYRPALRLSRARMQRGFFSAGSLYVPTIDVWFSLGPTFDPAWSGASLGLGGRVSILSLEARATLHRDDRASEFVLLVGLTDLHGLFALGPPRPDLPR